MGEPHVVTLRATRARDLDALFTFEHGGAMQPVASTPVGPADRAAFDAHWHRLIDDPSIDARTIRADGVIVGSVARSFEDGAAEITCWIEPAHRGEGIATRAIRLFLDALRERPVRARVAADDAPSIAVLDKLGFRQVGIEQSFVHGRGAPIEERIYRLD